MLFCLLLLSLYAAAAHGQDFVCGFGLGEDEVTAMSEEEIAFYRSSSSTDPIKILPLFGKFKDQKDPVDLNALLDRDGKKTESSTNLLDLTHKGSLAHFFYEMSYGALSLAISTSDRGLLGTWLESISSTRDPYFGKTSTNPATKADCGSDLSGWRNALRAFSEEILKKADVDVDFNNYDSDGDGIVSPVIAVFNPVAFSKLCGPNGTVLYISYTTNDHIGGDPSKAKIEVKDSRVITGDHSKSFPYLVGLMAHEYGHVLGLPELYDRTSLLEPSAPLDDHSAGIGYYGVMGKGNNGYATKRPGVVDGPAPLSEWSRIEMDWIVEQTPTNPDGRLVTVDADMPLSIHDINSDNGKVYKIPVLKKPSEYFLLANRQNTSDGMANKGSYYDEYAPQSGLLIYHVDEDVEPHRLPHALFPLNLVGGRPRNPYGIRDVNAYEEHKHVDVECADGLRYDDPSTTIVDFTDDSEKGGDNLDYWTGSNSTWKEARNGNIGDMADVWTSSKFTPYTNPSTDSYDGKGTADYKDDTQTVFSGIAMKGISQSGGVVTVNIHFIPLAPRKLKVVEATTNSVKLSWTEPVDNGATITGYEYSDGRVDAEGNTIWTALTTTGTGTITGTITGTTKLYDTFKVRAVTMNEKGQASAAVTVFHI